MKLIVQARSTSQRAAFHIGDLVSFQTNDGRVIQGEVLRLNKKTVTIVADDGQRWNVAPGLLRLEKAAGGGLVF